MKKWASVLASILNAAGVLIGFSMPSIAFRWSGPVELAQEHAVQNRAIIGIVLVLLGTLLQIYDSWPGKAER